MDQKALSFVQRTTISYTLTFHIQSAFVSKLARSFYLACACAPSFPQLLVILQNGRRKREKFLADGENVREGEKSFGAASKNTAKAKLSNQDGEPTANY